MGAPRIIFGIGAQKAGTTWLHRFLSSHPDCHAPKAKELHYFDDLYGPAPYFFLNQRIGRMSKLLESGTDAPQTAVRVQRLASIIGMFGVRSSGDAHSSYLDFILDGYEGQKIAIDITPAYATLGVEGFRQMLSAAPGAGFIFILRDPIERLWSSIRMKVKRSQAHGERSFDLDRFVDQVLSGELPSKVVRSDYCATLKTLEAVAPRDSIHIAFYEELFTPEAIGRLCDFLGIQNWPADMANKVNEGCMIDKPDGFDDRAMMVLRPVYEQLEARFGSAIPKSWKRAAGAAHSSSMVEVV